MKKIYFTITLICNMAVLYSQVKIDSSFTLSGSVDLYYRQNLNSTNDPENGGILAPMTSFSNLPGFSLGMANVIMAYQKEKISIVTDLVFGPRGADAVFNSPAPLNIINQLNVSYQFNDQLSFTFGKFNTFLGYEVISPVANLNYSTSYLFSYGPFSHTGVKANYKFDNGFNIMGSVMNPTDFTDFNPYDTYLGGLQLGYTHDRAAIFINSLLSKEFYQVDVTATASLSGRYGIGLNASLAQKLFAGVALYQKYALTDYMDIGVRLEVFDDKGLALIEEGGSTITNITFSLPLKSGNFRIIPEYRVDIFNSKNKNKNPILLDGAQIKYGNQLSSLVVAAIANF